MWSDSTHHNKFITVISKDDASELTSDDCSSYYLWTSSSSKVASYLQSSNFVGSNGDTYVVNLPSNVDQQKYKINIVHNPPTIAHKNVRFDTPALPGGTPTKNTHLFAKTNHTISIICKLSSPIIGIPDNGCTHGMISNITMFEHISMFKSKDDNIPCVKLEDDNTTIVIKGYGMMNYLLDNHGVRKMGYYVPNRGTTLISIK